MSVYALRDPRTGDCRYVGHTKDPADRLKSHARRPHSRSLRGWNRELRDLGLSPQMEILGPGTEADWIARLRPDLNVEEGDPFAIEDAKSGRIDMRLSSDEKDLFFRAAEADGLPFSLWVRRVCKAAAQKLLGEGAPKKKKGGAR